MASSPSSSFIYEIPPLKNILRHAGGPTRYILQRSDDITDIFLELLDRRNIDDIVEFTNAEATRSGKPNFNLDSVEFIAFIGLCLARGVAKGRNEPLSSFWSDDTGRPMFRETMSRNRFKDIMRFFAIRQQRPAQISTTGGSFLFDLYCLESGDEQQRKSISTS